MDPELYTAAHLGDWVLMKRFSGNFYSQKTSTGNTVLHVLAQFCDSAEVARHILAGHFCLLMKKNVHGETALHLAARKGHLGIVRALIASARHQYPHSRFRFPGFDGCKRMLRMANVDGNTALHEAVRNNFYEVAKLLVQEDPEFHYRPNYAMETPLYLAVEKGYHDIVDLILVTCKSSSYLGPGNRTALHAAAIRNSPEVELILQKLPNLTTKVDKFGWNALHYAAKFNHQGVVRQLLSKYKFMAYVTANNDDSMTALHIAVTQGHVAVIQELLLHCPDCWERITYKLQNILHLAVKYEQREVLEFFLQYSWASELINQKDSKGNTPLHLYVATKNLDGNSLVNHPCVDISAFDNSNSTVLDNILHSRELTGRQVLIKEELERAGASPGYRNVATVKKNLGAPKTEEPEKLESLAGTYLIVATLIATVTFTAGFTIPGGFNDSDSPNKGLAVLGNKAIFITFVISDSLAIMISVHAVLHLILLLQSNNRKFKLAMLHGGRASIFMAMILMMIAFLTGLSSVLPMLHIKILLCVLAAIYCYHIPLDLVQFLRNTRSSRYVTMFRHTEADYSWYIGPFRVWVQDLTEEDEFW
ncbi:protein ACCELERATED CELL DEATH 6-like [Coffea eugenioides]|uniref:protein ACCELERATED CELL DEATH 6-like n=1 Tax=Coffea eugenioides TaxID=49369 RepID=UPI000F60C709|nr:protein ACCELERATED CELL DEATH 6-like [Coffea eugenioides]